MIRSPIKASADYGIGYKVNEAMIEDLSVRRETVPLK
jgi:hypothetical protein